MTPPQLEPGRIVGQKYTIRRLVSRGVLSVLYDAITAPNREVLLEVFAPPPPETADLAVRLDRVVSEVNALPATVVLPVIEAGVDGETGCPFIASSASVTPALAELVKLCPLTGEELVAFIARLCSALDAAHSRSLLHAGLDPTKVFVGPAPRFDVRLAGLGAFTITGRAGERAWASPEAHATPSIASDVYSAALCALYAGTGSLPEDPAAFLRGIAEDGDGATMDARFAEPLLRALATKPEDRPRTAGELASAVTAALGSSFTVSARWPVVIPADAVPPPPAVASVDALTAPIPTPQNARGSRAKIFGAIAAAATLLVLGVVAIAIVIGGRTRTPASEPHVAAPPPVVSSSFSAITIPPEPISQPAPAPAPAPPPAASASADPARPKTEAGLVVTCIPECDSITVDGKAVDSFPATLKPGAHSIAARRGYHAPQYRFLQLSGGRDTKVQFIWRKPPAPKKP